MDEIDKFHAHLDECRQCREHPFGLCLSGAVLLQVAALGGPQKMSDLKSKKVRSTTNGDNNDAEDEDD